MSENTVKRITQVSDQTGFTVLCWFFYLYQFRSVLQKTDGFNAEIRNISFVLPCGGAEDDSDVFSRVVSGVLDVHIPITSIERIVKGEVHLYVAIGILETGFDAIQLHKGLDYHQALTIYKWISIYILTKKYLLQLTIVY